MTAVRATARAPVRLDFAGAWTDVAPYATEVGGAVVNAALAVYAHAEYVPGGDGYRLRAEDLRVETTGRTPEDLPDGGPLALLRRRYAAGGRRRDCCAPGRRRRPVPALAARGHSAWRWWRLSRRAVGRSLDPDRTRGRGVGAGDHRRRPRRREAGPVRRRLRRPAPVRLFVAWRYRPAGATARRVRRIAGATPDRLLHRAVAALVARHHAGDGRVPRAAGAGGGRTAPAGRSGGRDG